MDDKERIGYHLVAAHIRGVQTWMKQVANLWFDRAVKHDQSKYSSHELPLIQQKAYLDTVGLNTPEYFDALEQAESAVKAHYRYNTHHPEHYENGVADMSLLDLMEMICDWRAAAEMNGTDVAKSLEMSLNRFKIPAVLSVVIINTYRELGWIARVEDA